MDQDFIYVRKKSKQTNKNICNRKGNAGEWSYNKDECQHAPSMSREPETGNMRLKNDAREWLCENVCSVLDTRSVFDDKRVGFNMRANKMIVDVDVLGLSMIRVIG